MKNNPIISVIVPFYNSGEIIKNSIESLKNQTSDNFEVIFINDGSTDNSLEVLKENLNDCKFNYEIINKINEGVSIARNVGIEEAKGNYVYFLDADDFIDKNLITKVINTISINESSPDIVYWGWDKINENNIVFEKYENNYAYIDDSSSLLNDYMLHKIWIWTGSAVYRKKFLKENKINFLESVAFAEDIAFIFSAIYKAKNVKNIKESLSYYYINSKSVTNNFNFKRLTTFKVVNHLEKIIDKSSEEERIFEDYFKPELYWNTINGLLSYKKENYKAKKIIKNLLKNYYIRKYLKKYKMIGIKRKIIKIMILYTPSLFLFVKKKGLYFGKQ
jgi:glycosyltransferase involved in cell wall biosynthesis